MKVVTWNIAAAHTVRSKKRFDYADEDLAYFVNQLRALKPDVICLQESHVNAERSLAKEIARALGGYNVFDSPLSQSHIDPVYQVALSTITKEPFSDCGFQAFPPPDFDLFFANGNKAIKDTKGVQFIDYKGVRIANAHALPLIVFNYDYRYGAGSKLAGKIESVISSVMRNRACLCGDLGLSNEQSTVFGSLYATFNLQNALPPAQPTHYRQSEVGGLNAPDVILYNSGELHASKANVTKTDTDHFLCWTELN